jgi:hypothetical protein
VIAQEEVQTVRPDAGSDGYLLVYDERLGLN